MILQQEKKYMKKINRTIRRSIAPPCVRAMLLRCAQTQPESRRRQNGDQMQPNCVSKCDATCSAKAATQFKGRLSGRFLCAKCMRARVLAHDCMCVCVCVYALLLLLFFFSLQWQPQFAHTHTIAADKSVDSYSLTTHPSVRFKVNEQKL